MKRMGLLSVCVWTFLLVMSMLLMLWTIGAMKNAGMNHLGPHGPLLAMNENRMMAVYRTVVEFGGSYLVLGACTIVAASVLLRKRDAHDAIYALVLFVCTIVLGTRLVWTAWYVAEPVPLAGAYMPDWHGIVQARAISLKVAWAFMALAGHFFITAAGRLCRHWKSTSNRIAVLLCAFTMCIGPLGAWRCYMRWHKCFEPEVERIMANRDAALRLTDDATAQMVLETPDEWPVLVVRGHYLLDVGRIREARQALRQALHHVPEDKTSIRQGIMDEIMRTTVGAMP
jgi:hypothetical protein